MPVPCRCRAGAVPVPAGLGVLGAVAAAGWPRGAAAGRRWLRSRRSRGTPFTGMSAGQVMGGAARGRGTEAGSVDAQSRARDEGEPWARAAGCRAGALAIYSDETWNPKQ